MKLSSLLFLVILLLTTTGCVKVIAGEEENIDVKALHNQRFGRSAHDLLSDVRYTSLRIEVQYMHGFAPDQQALNNLQVFMERYLNKPEGIFIETKEIEPVADSILRREDVIEIERKSRTVYSRKKELGLFLIYTNGSYSNPKILGLAYQNTSAVILGKPILEHSGRIGQPDRTKLETTVLLHEVGHLLGLINKGSDMISDHQDDNHESHCSNKNCLMYYSIGTEDRFGYLVKGSIPQLDDHCEADLKANGGK
jgi:hypothetical protein